MKLSFLVVRALGADHAQWKGLVGSLMKAGFRSAQSSTEFRKMDRNPRLVSWLETIALGFFGLVLALMAAVVPTPFLLSLVVITATALAVFFVLLANFQELAVSPLDYQVLGHRPVGSRTYLLSRLTVTMAHQGIVAGLIAGPSTLVCAFRFGLLTALGQALAVAMIVLGIVLALIGAYGALIRRVKARRLTRALSYMQLFLGLVAVLPALLMNRSSLSPAALSELAPEGWVLAIPTVWFASIPGLAGGTAAAGHWLGAALAFAGIGACGWIARDKLSLQSAQKLGQELQVQARQDTGQQRPGHGSALPGPLYVAAVLIRGQFRHDTRFRMGVFGILPLFALYMVMAFRATETFDPFVPGAATLPLFWINFALLLAPVTLLEQLYPSDSHQAGWIFFAAPTDRARLAGDARHCVTLFFFVPFLALAAASLVWLFEAAFHAALHILLLGFLGVVAMQVFQFLDPRLPFTLPVARRQRWWVAGLRTLGLAFFAAALGPYLQFAYARPGWAVGTFAVAALSVTLMELTLPRRLNRSLRWLEGEG